MCGPAARRNGVAPYPSGPVGGKTTNQMAPHPPDTATRARSGERHPEPDEFGIEITFAPHSDAPSRVFRALTGMIEAFQEIDTLLVGSIRSTLQPSTLLEDIEAGSVKVWLRNALIAI